MEVEKKNRNLLIDDEWRAKQREAMREEYKNMLQGQVEEQTKEKSAKKDKQ